MADNAPVDLDCEVPDDLLEIEDPSQARVQGDFAMLGERRWIRGALELRFRAGRRLAYRCWAQVSGQVFEMAWRLCRDARTRAMTDFTGMLANAVPPFEGEKGVNVRGTWPHGSERIVLRALEGELAAAQAEPGLSGEDFDAILGEAMQSAQAEAVEKHLESLWGMATAAEEFEGKDWRRGPRRVVICEFKPEDLPWQYVTAGLSARPMPRRGESVELLWELGRRVTAPAIFAAMARMATMPWHLRQAFFDGHVQPFPQGFPPDSQFRGVLCFDAARRAGGPLPAELLGRKVRFLCALPVVEADRQRITPENFAHYLKQVLGKVVETWR